MRRCLRCGRDALTDGNVRSCMSRECEFHWSPQIDRLDNGEFWPMEYALEKPDRTGMDWKHVPIGCLGVFGWEEN